MAKSLPIGIILFSLAATVVAQDSGLREAPRGSMEMKQARPAEAPMVAGDCALGEAKRILHGNNVSAQLLNNGHLFGKGSGNLYEVPAYSGRNSIFSSGIWIGGMSGGGLRFAGTTYGPYEFWPGPLDDGGNPPDDCEPYDRIYLVSQRDLDRYHAGDPATPDIQDWPWHLGAPVEDGDGDPDNYDLAGGDRPGILGHQTAWWVMNDAAGAHAWSQAPPIKMEVQVTAYAVSTPDALDNTTFYRYKLIYRGEESLTDAWFGMWSDPDLGNASDDYVGSDTALGMGFVYNGDDIDEGFGGYGEKPPALGYLFVQGPLAHGRRLGMTQFLRYWADDTAQGDPRSGSDAYHYLRARWRDGTPLTLGEPGYRGDTPTSFMYPGDPVERRYWSEEDNGWSRNTPSDRFFVASTGPFTMNPGDVQEITVAIVWAQGEDRLDSVTRLREAAVFVIDAFDSGAIEDYPAPDRLPAPEIELSTDHIAVSLAPRESTTRVLNISNTGTADFSWTASDSDTRITRFLVTANANGPLDPPEMGTFAFNGNGFPTADGRAPSCTDDAMTGSLCNDRPTQRQQVGPGRWGINVGFGNGTFASYMDRAITSRDNLQRLGVSDYEWRFTGSSRALRRFEDEALVDVPFELWNVGIGSPEDPSDDFRMIPVICEMACGGGRAPMVFDIGGDHPVSGAADDPLTDWTYWYNPADMSPGESGYLKFINDGDPDLDEFGGEVLARQVIVGLDAGPAPPYAQELPEPGTIFRIETISQWVLPAPSFGRLGPGESMNIALDIGTALEPGIYHDSLTISHSVPERPAIVIPVVIEVLETTGVESTEHPREYTLGQNYPNPFNPATTIRFGLPAAGPVRLVLYDVLGRQVKVLVDEMRAAGRHSISLDAGGLPAGAYFYRLTAGEHREVKSMLLVK